MTIGQRIYTLRKEKGLSQEELAERLNVSRQTVSKWENDQVLPDLYNLQELSRVLGCTSDELLTGTKPKEENNNDLVEAMKYGETLVRKHWAKIGYHLVIVGAVALLFTFVANAMFSSFFSDSMFLFGDAGSQKPFEAILLLPLIIGVVCLVAGVVLIIVDRKKNAKKDSR